jgi:hypothetical protein
MTCATCLTCDLGLHHCHAIVVRHDDGGFDCLDGCGGPLAVHDDVVDCVELGLSCCHAAVEQPDHHAVELEPAWAA